MPVAIPLAVAGLATSLAGTGAQIAAGAATRRKQNEVLEAQMNKQNELYQQTKPVVAAAVKQSGAEAAQQQLGQGAAQAVRDYQTAQGTQMSNASNPATAMTTGSYSNDPLLKGQIALSNQAAGAMQGYNQMALDQAVNNLLVSGKLSNIGALSRNAQSSYPLQLADAQQQYAGLQGAGQLANSLGSTLGMYAMTQPAKTPFQSGAISTKGFDYNPSTNIAGLV